MMFFKNGYEEVQQEKPANNEFIFYCKENILWIEITKNSDFHILKLYPVPKKFNNLYSTLLNVNRDTAEEKSSFGHFKFEVSENVYFTVATDDLTGLLGSLQRSGAISEKSEELIKSQLKINSITNKAESGTGSKAKYISPCKIL